MMNSDVIRFTMDALWLVLLLSLPPIIAASVVGIFVAVIQAATQIQEQTMQYTLKFIAIVATIFLTASLLAANLLQFADRIFTDFPGLVR